MSPFTALAIVALSNARSLLIRKLRSPSRIGIRSENSCSRSFLRFKVPMVLPLVLPDLPARKRVCCGGRLYPTEYVFSSVIGPLAVVVHDVGHLTFYRLYDRNRCRSHLGMALTELIEGFPCDGVYGILAGPFLPSADPDLDIAGVELSTGADASRLLCREQG